MTQTTLPYQPGSATSYAAAQSMVPHATNQRAQIYFWLMARIPFGGICDEWYADHGDPHSPIGTRFVELERLGLVRREGTRPTRTGRDAEVFHAIPQPLGPDSFKQPPRPPSLRERVRQALLAIRGGDCEAADEILTEALG